MAGDGVKMSYADTGQGSPMVLLHGIGMDWRVWQSVSRRLGRERRLLIPDLRGHGQSGKPGSGYTLADYASDIELLVDELGLVGTTLVGSSLGGMVAAVVEAPVRAVARRVLVDPPLVRGSGPKRPLFEAILTIKLSERTKEETVKEIYRALRGEEAGVGNLFLRYMAETWTECAPGVLREALNPVETPGDIDSALAAIESPVLLMRANPARGGVLGHAAVRRALSLLPHGEEQYFEGSGHAIHGSEPDAFARAVDDFERRTAGAAV